MHTISEPEYDYFYIKSANYPLDIKIFSEVEYYKWIAGKTAYVEYKSNRLTKDRFSHKFDVGIYVLWIKPYAQALFDTESSRVSVKIQFSKFNHWENLEE